MSHTKEHLSLGGTWEENFDGTTMQCAGIVESENVIAAAFDEDFYIAKERARHIVACVNFCAGVSIEKLENSRCGEYQQFLLKERDTYRDLCAELLKAANDYLPYMPVSSVKKGGAYIYIGMLRASDNLKDAIAKVVSILGEKNGNAN